MAGAMAGAKWESEAHPGGFELGLDDNSIALSAGLLQLFGLGASRFDGRAGPLLDRIYPADLKQLRQQLRKASRQLVQHDLRIMGGDGHLHWFSVEARIDRTDAGKPRRLRGVLRKIDQHLALERRVHDQQAALFQLLARDRLDTLPLDQALARLTREVSRALAVERVAVWRLNPEKDLLRCQCLYLASSDSEESGEELRAEEYPRYFEALSSGRAVAASDALRDPRTSEFAQSYLAPRNISSLLDATVRRGGRTVGVICHEHTGPARQWTLDEEQFAASVADVVAMLYESQERRELLERLRHESSHDGLTGLPNRVLLRELIDAQSDSCTGVLMIIDLDHFSEINDTLGHDVGDELLVAMGRRLNQHLGQRGVLARLGGDEFAYWQTDVAGPEQALEIARSLQQQIRHPIEAAGVRFAMNGSIGISLFPDHGQGSHELLRCADVALYRAKKSLSGCRLYAADDDRHSPRRLTLMHDLRAAAQAGRIGAVFQPKFRLSDGRMTGVEALARWNHPELGAINPAEFIPLAELGDMIVDLTSAVLRQTGEALRDWHSVGLELPVAVNLSAAMLSDPELAALLIEQVEAAGIPWPLLELEITESAYLEDPDQALVSMNMLRERGAKFHLDDFGVGYSSFSHLSQMPIDALKIDRRFVQGLLEEPRCAAIVQSAIQLADNLGLRAIAEGVECSSVREQLARYGCDEAQGFLLGRPVAAGDIATFTRPSREPEQD